jgi:hypothetical protein
MKNKKWIIKNVVPMVNVCIILIPNNENIVDVMKIDLVKSVNLNLDQIYVVQHPCAPYSECVIFNEEKKQRKCICPLGKSGDQCYITYNLCSNIRYQNSGTYLPFDGRNFGYSCICTNEYTGCYCQVRGDLSYVSIDTKISNLSSIPALVSVSHDETDEMLNQRSRVLHANVTLPTTLKLLLAG